MYCGLSEGFCPVEGVVEIVELCVSYGLVSDADLTNGVVMY